MSAASAWAWVERHAIEMQLQRADAGDDVDDAGQRHALQFDHQRMDADAQFEIEDDRAVFDKDVAVALLAIDGARSAAGGGQVGEDGGEAGDTLRRGGDFGGGCVACQPVGLHRGSDGSRIGGDDIEGDTVARRELPDLPQIGGDDDERADEAAQRRAIGAEDDRHVAGEIDGADGIGVVVDVRRVQPGLAAVGPRPMRLRADQADAGAVGVVVHLPAGGGEGFDVVGREEIRRAVRAIEHAQSPFLADRRRRGDRGARCRLAAIAEMQRVAGEQPARGVAAEFAEIEGAAAAQIGGNVEPAGDEQIAAHAATADPAEAQLLALGRWRRAYCAAPPRHRASHRNRRRSGRWWRRC